MIEHDDGALIREFLEAVQGTGKSPEQIAAEIGGKPSAPTIRRWMRDDLPKSRLSRESREGIRRYMTSHEDVPGEPTLYGTTSSSSDIGLLDQWGLARARAVEKLADLLERDRRILELRAEAALNASIAARLEEEKAPSRDLDLSSDLIELLYQMGEKIRELHLQGATGTGGRRAESPAALE